MYVSGFLYFCMFILYIFEAKFEDTINSGLSNLLEGQVV